MVIADIFSARHHQGLCMRVEAALARVQAGAGIIPRAAADEIARTADPAFVDPARVAAGRETLGHTFVALLEPWAEILAGDAREWLHYGATSADILDTVAVLQCRAAAHEAVADLAALEASLLALAARYRATVMIGRTVGRHALPITFGLKVANWLGENRRAIDRIEAWLARTDTGVLSGAVGSYAALGPQAFAIEAAVMRELGLAAPWPMDWKGSRDMFAEYASVLAIAARTWAKIAQEIFLLQGDDIGELAEVHDGIGSSTMPHKRNPLHSRAVIARSREVVHLAGVLLDWMVSIHERDQISSSDTLATCSIAFERLLQSAAKMLAGLRVNDDVMRRNIDRTHGLIMAEAAVFLLSERLGKHTAHQEVRLAAACAVERGTTLVEELRARPRIAADAADLDFSSLLDPAASIGLAPESVDRTIAHIHRLRGTAERIAVGS
jgi:adenylosuccinate lyase